MNANELRIGNEIRYLSASKNWINKTVDLQVLQIFQQSKPSARDFKPIPLTEQWLIKLGFEGDDIDRWIVLPNGDASELHIEKELLSEELNIQFTRGDSSTIPGKEHDYVYAGKIEFVHQLQNLYYSLTGEELV